MPSITLHVVFSFKDKINDVAVHVQHVIILVHYYYDDDYNKKYIIHRDKQM